MPRPELVESAERAAGVLVCVQLEEPAGMPALPELEEPAGMPALPVDMVCALGITDEDVCDTFSGVKRVC